MLTRLCFAFCSQVGSRSRPNSSISRGPAGEISVDGQPAVEVSAELAEAAATLLERELAAEGGAEAAGAGAEPEAAAEGQ